jgi:peptidyl-tRNA hydrolase
MENTQIDHNQIENILKDIENQKNQLTIELQDLQVKSGILDQNIQEMDQVILSQFGTNDLNELQNILDQKSKELQELINQVNQVEI